MQGALCISTTFHQNLHPRVVKKIITSGHMVCIFFKSDDVEFEFVPDWNIETSKRDMTSGGMVPARNAVSAREVEDSHLRRDGALQGDQSIDIW